MKQRLGKGVKTLNSTLNEAVESATFGQLKLLKTEELHPGKYQPRESFSEAALEQLVESIKEAGLIQAIVVRFKNEKYEIVSGERRWRASKLAGLGEVPCIVKQSSNAKAAKDSLIENMLKEELNNIELAKNYKRLISDFNMTHAKISSLVGKSRATITNAIRLLKLEDDTQKALSLGEIEMGHARALLSLADPLQQLKALSKITQKKLTVRDAEKMIAKWGEDIKETRSRQSEAERRIGQHFTSIWRAKVKCTRNTKGEIVINAAFQDDRALEDALGITTSEYVNK